MRNLDITAIWDYSHGLTYKHLSSLGHLLTKNGITLLRDNKWTCFQYDVYKNKSDIVIDIGVCWHWAAEHDNVWPKFSTLVNKMNDCQFRPCFISEKYGVVRWIG